MLTADCAKNSYPDELLWESQTESDSMAGYTHESDLLVHRCWECGSMVPCQRATWQGAHPSNNICSQQILFVCHQIFSSHVDLAPNFSGTLFGISNTVSGGGMGSIAPLVLSLFQKTLLKRVVILSKVCWHLWIFCIHIWRRSLLSSVVYAGDHRHSWKWENPRKLANCVLADWRHLLHGGGSLLHSCPGWCRALRHSLVWCSTSTAWGQLSSCFKLIARLVHANCPWAHLGISCK